MKNLKAFIASIMIISSLTVHAQIKNATTSTVEIKGNCAMCKKTIEAAAYEPKVSKAEWDEDTQQAVLTFNPDKTSEEAILKKIAQAGYDNQSFRAPDDVYAKLHECCLYERDHTVAKAEHNEHQGMDHSQHKPSAKEHANMGHSQHNGDATANTQLAPVFKNYLAVKNALVATDAKAAATAAKALTTSIGQVEMGKLAHEEHEVWMKVMKGIHAEAASIEKSTDISKQRQSFMALSNHVYSLAKASKGSTALYWQFCPMANNNKGAYWLSAEDAIKNPYFGSKMMNCGEVKEKI
ncbi:MAG: DUF3347 domain-containing protein [Sphingobacterium hotanense]